MTNEPKSFDKLLEEAPAPAAADTMSVVGLISRAASPEEFVFTAADGQTVTLERKAVKGHAVLGGAVGQQIVRLDLDHTQLPADTVKALNQSGRFSNAALPTIQYYDVPHIGLPSLSVQSAAGPARLAPFVAAFPHHVDPSTLAALAIISGSRTYITAYEWTSDHSHLFKVQADQP